MPSSRIFIVEDSFIVSLHLQKVLQHEGYYVIGTADSAEIALEKIMLHKPDLVFMDIMLDGKMDGIQAAIIIREKLSIPVVFITALTDSETISRAKVAEPFGYLKKPFDDRDIFTAVEMALCKSESEKGL